MTTTTTSEKTIQWAYAYVYEKQKDGSWHLIKGISYKSLSSARRGMRTWGNRYIGMGFRKYVGMKPIAHQLTNEMLSNILASSKGYQPQR